MLGNTTRHVSVLLKQINDVKLEITIQINQKDKWADIFCLLAIERFIFTCMGYRPPSIVMKGRAICSLNANI
jgi:hypothetical protein